MFERRPELEGGVALGVQPNGRRALQVVGALDRLDSVLSRIPGGRLVIVPGERTLAEFDYESAGLRDLSPSIVLRSELLRCLADLACDAGVDLRLGCPVDAVDADGSVDVQSRRHAFDALVGADGSSSVVRGSLGVGDRVLTPWTAARAVVAGRAVPGAIEYWGPRARRFGVIAVRTNLTYLYASAPRADFLALRAGDLSGWKSLWVEFGETVTGLVDVLRDPDVLRIDDIVEVHCRHWVHRRVFLLGDAAHAMTPDLGQGANTAMVDALTLAFHLVSGSGAPVDVSSAGRAYERARMRSVRRVQRTSRMVGAAAHMRSSAVRRAGGVLANAVSRPAFVRRRAAKTMAAIPRRDERVLSALAKAL